MQKNRSNASRSESVWITLDGLLAFFFAPTKHTKTPTVWAGHKTKNSGQPKREKIQAVGSGEGDNEKTVGFRCFVWGGAT